MSYIFGGRPDDYIWDTGTGARLAGVPIAVKDSDTLAPVTGLADLSGTPITEVTSDAIGRYGFQCDSPSAYFDVTDSTGVVRWGPISSVTAVALAVRAIPSAVQAASDASDARADAETAAAAAIAAGKYSTVAVDDTLLPARATINFTGAVVVTDDATGDATTVKVPQADIRIAQLAANVNLGRPGTALQNVTGLVIALDSTVGNTADVAIDIEAQIHYSAGAAADAKICMVLPTGATNIIGKWCIRDVDTTGTYLPSPITTATGVVPCFGGGAGVRQVADFEARFNIPPGIASPAVQLQMCQNGTEAVDLVVFSRSFVQSGRAA